ncbi:FAD-binding monooxygenase [Reticulibacter mediterranei]|uniref:FAD-binding monooxygenase n=1 Tax=Reticulibacter mediterranei TaxID=2778369 RepID=A0A8J3IEE6_9CHLR|nr:FAD-dependent monooxygenase [Reticulibacter mediterranei]GHO90965.1 FAD-binding monooxygenase [Reticulibacter mediterranei]
MTQEHVPVLIVGAGGAGLSLSLLLHQQGISSLLIERRIDTSWYPRARSLNFRTIEVLRGLGLEAEVLAGGAKLSRMFRKHSLAASEQEEILNPIAEVEHLEDITQKPLAWYYPQSKLEPLLLAEARRRSVDVRYGTELVSFTQDETGVMAVIKDRTTRKESEVRADYLIAADGAHSRIRETLAIPTQGLGALPECQIFAYFRADWGALVAGYENDVFQIVNKDVRGLFMITDQQRGLFMISYSPARGETAQDYPAERCQKLIRLALGKADLDVSVVDIADWKPIQRVADRFQQGRIFLVGDAAHTMPPYLGLGVNTAIQSAQNLGWKLAAVLKGQATPELLATYQTERRPVGLLAAQQSMVGSGAILFGKDISEARGSALPDLQDQLSIMHPIVGYRYCSEAILSEDAATPVRDGIELLKPLELNGLPGTRVPHLWVEREGQRISTLDLFDGRFVLLAGPGGTAWDAAAPEVAASLGIELAVYRIGSDGGLLDGENSWQTKMGTSVEGVVLVRPDGFVAWRSSIQPKNPVLFLEQVLSRILCRSTAPTYL